MPQMGLHLSLGLLPVRYNFFSALTSRKGFLIGGVIPDFDFALLIPIYFFDRKLALSMHRAFSHSLLACGGLFAIALLMRAGRRLRKTTNLLIGIAAGMALHTLLDFFMWFAPVRILWPVQAGYAIFPPDRIPEFAWNLSFSLESACYAIFLFLLARITRTPFEGRVRLISLMLTFISAILVALSFFLSRGLMEPLSYAPAIIIGFGFSAYHIMRSWQRLFPPEKGFHEK